MFGVSLYVQSSFDIVYNRVAYVAFTWFWLSYAAVDLQKSRQQKKAAASSHRYNVFFWSF